jgi:flavorubredoxin
MKADNKVLRVTDDVSWIGVLDYDIVTFDVVMETKYGTTYNSYFIDADKKAIIETTKASFWETYLNKITQVTVPEEIEYIILNHTEPDHSGNVLNLLKLAPNAKIVGSGNAIRYLGDMFEVEFPHIIVKDGDTLDLGNKTLKFISAPNLHWPDTIYSYLEEDKVLFTCDSFGAHYCDDRMYDDEVADFREAFTYYFDVILKPFSKYMIRAIDKIRDLPVDIICTGHGPILRSNWKELVDLSEEYSREHLKYPEKNKVFIPYVSAYQKTGTLAEGIARGLREAGDIEVLAMDIEHSTVGELESQLTSSNAVIVGCPTINQNILLPIYKLFAAINPIRDHKKLAGGFGSYGWSGEGRKMIESNLSNLKLKYFGEGVFIKFTPDEKEIAHAQQYGKEFGEKLLSQ